MSAEIDAWVIGRVEAAERVHLSHVTQRWGEVAARAWWASRPAMRLRLAVVDLRAEDGRLSGDLVMYDLDQALAGHLPGWLLPFAHLRGRALGVALGHLS